MYWYVQTALIYFCVFYILLMLLTKLVYYILDHYTSNNVKKNLYKQNIIIK